MKKISKNGYSLEELLKNVTDENIYPEIDEESGRPGPDQQLPSILFDGISRLSGCISERSSILNYDGNGMW